MGKEVFETQDEREEQMSLMVLDNALDIVQWLAFPYTNHQVKQRDIFYRQVVGRILDWTWGCMYQNSESIGTICSNYRYGRN